jgi:hypothetical protein
MSQVATNLKLAYDLIQDPATRCLEHFAVNEDGLKVSPFSENAKKFCSLGSILRVLYGTQAFRKSEGVRLINQMLQGEEYGHLLVASKEHGFDSVLDMQERATEDKFNIVWTSAILLAAAE